MLYFKTLKIENTDPEIIEKAIRAFSLKRFTSLDIIISSASYASEEKYFFGLVFLLFTWFEFMLVRNRINKAIEKTGVTEFLSV